MTSSLEHHCVSVTKWNGRSICFCNHMIYKRTAPSLLICRPFAKLTPGYMPVGPLFPIRSARGGGGLASEKGGRWKTSTIESSFYDVAGVL